VSPEPPRKRIPWEPPVAGEEEDWSLLSLGSGIVREEAADTAEDADAEAEAAEEGVEGRDIRTMTTIILRNVPNSYSRDDLIDFLDSQGFHGRYDFLYLPVKFGSSSAFGYALINLIDHDEARRFQAHFQNFSNWNVECSNVASVSWSKAHQGLEEHIERYRNSPMMHSSMPDECKPIILDRGFRMPFPPPTKKAAPQRRTERTRNSRRREKAEKGGPGSVSSLASEVSCSSDHWKAASVSSAMSTPAGTSSQLAEPTASPLLQGLTWLGGGGEEPREAVRPEGGLYQLTTQMICGSDCSSETSLRSSVPSQLGGSCAPSSCSSNGRRAHRHRANTAHAGASWSNTLLAAGLEAVPDADEPFGPAPEEDRNYRHKKSRWWNSRSSGNSQNSASSHNESPRRSPQRAQVHQQNAFEAGLGPMLPGTIVELVGSAGPAGQQGRVLVVDHAREEYKVQLDDGNVRMLKAKQVRFMR